jgi:hypothetical protein
MMACDIGLLLEKKNIYYPPRREKKEEKYQGKFTNDDFHIREVVDEIHRRNKRSTMSFLRTAIKQGCTFMHQTRHWLPLRGRDLLSSYKKLKSIVMARAPL